MDELELDNRFTYHPPKDGQAAQFVAVRSAARKFAELLDFNVPDGRELSLAMTHLEEVVFWANAGLARSTPVDFTFIRVGDPRSDA